MRRVKNTIYSSLRYNFWITDKMETKLNIDVKRNENY